MFALIECIEIGGHFVKDQKADIISIFYDVGGIVGECYNRVLVFCENIFDYHLSNLLIQCHNCVEVLMDS